MHNAYSPDFKKSYSKANELLVKSHSINNFPFSPKDIIKEHKDIRLCSYSKAADKYCVDINALGSESAIIMKMGCRNIIFYDKTKPVSHVNYSILHEFGHYFLGHNFSSKNEDLYNKNEIETNFFAAQILMPEQLLRELQKRGFMITPCNLELYFGVSNQAALKRIETLAKTNYEWRSREEKEYDDIILSRYADFLNRICPTNKIYNFEDEYERQLERSKWY